MFFEADGEHFPIAEIACIGERRKDPRQDFHEIELKSGRTVRAPSYVVNRILQTPASTFAALPETYVVSTMMETNEVYFAAVIGWAMDMLGYICPITAQGVNDGDDGEVAVVTPDGKVSLTRLGGLYDSVDEWLAVRLKVA